MNSKLFLLFLCCVFTIISSVSASYPKSISLIQLIVTPERFHQKEVVVIGVVSLGFERDALFFHQEDIVYRVKNNGIWLGDLPKKCDQLDGRYVRLRGKFNQRNGGHLGVFKGGVENITSMYTWPTPHGSKHPFIDCFE